MYFDIVTLAAQPSGWIPIGISAGALFTALTSAIVAFLSLRVSRKSVAISSAAYEASGAQISATAEHMTAFKAGDRNVQAAIYVHVINSGRAPIQLTNAVLAAPNDDSRFIRPVERIKPPMVIQGLSTETLIFAYNSGATLIDGELNLSGQKEDDCKIQLYFGNGTIHQTTIRAPIPPTLPQATGRVVEWIRSIKRIVPSETVD
jgi:hypothetical protein